MKWVEGRLMKDEGTVNSVLGMRARMDSGEAKQYHTKCLVEYTYGIAATVCVCEGGGGPCACVVVIHVGVED